jgi:hypothetical protein
MNTKKGVWSPSPFESRVYRYACTFFFETTGMPDTISTTVPVLYEHDISSVSLIAERCDGMPENC